MGSKKSVIPKSKYYTIKDIVERVKKIGNTQGINTAFTTYLEMLALGFACETDPTVTYDRKKRYEEIENGLSAEVLSEYGSLCALTYLVAKQKLDDPIDILGAVYHELNLNNEWNGQFFTPDNICRMMAMMINPSIQQTDVSGFSTVSEPSCGSGTMVIAAVWSMLKSNIDYQSDVIFIAQDIDIRCVWMAYIQFCLYRIPAVVIHGNTLTGEEWSRWYTPFYWNVLAKHKKSGGDANE